MTTKQTAEKSLGIHCCHCGVEILADETFYTHYMIAESRDGSEGLKIFNVKPLEHRCRFCTGKGATVC